MQGFKILEPIQGNVISTFGNGSVEVNSCGSFDSSKEGVVFFLKALDILFNVECPKSCVFILPENVSDEIRKKIEEANSFGVSVNDPRLAFVRILDAFFAPPRPRGVHPTAIIHKSVSLGEGCYIGPYVVVDENCILGDRTVIHANVHIYNNVKIGNDCTLHSGVMIGSDGFGFQKNESHSYEKFHQIGGVVIGNNVEIGAGTCISRGALDDTVIGDRVKMDNLVHVAHNVVVGDDTILTANVMVAGSVVIGRRNWIAPSVALMNGIKTGDDVFVGLGAVVIRDIASGETVVGNPARPLEEYKKISSFQKKMIGN